MTYREFNKTVRDEAKELKYYTKEIARLAKENPEGNAKLILHAISCLYSSANRLDKAYNYYKSSL